MSNIKDNNPSDQANWHIKKIMNSYWMFEKSLYYPQTNQGLGGHYWRILTNVKVLSCVGFRGQHWKAMSDQTDLYFLAKTNMSS